MTSNLKEHKELRKILFSTLGILMSLTIITCSTQSFAEDLTLSLLPPTQDSSPNQNVDITLSLSYPNGATASMFQLEVNYDTDVLENPTATRGEVLINADKDISASQPSPGVFRIVASGLNQNIIQAGNAATIGFHVKATAPLGETDLTLSNLAATDPDEQSLDPLGSGASINIIVLTIPTLSECGLIIFMTLIMGMGVVILYRRRVG